MFVSLRARLVCCSLTTLALLGLPTASLADDPPALRAFWADAFNPGFKSQSQITSLVSRAVTGNYNAIIVEVLAYQDTGGNGHGAYWNSSIVPKAADISGGIDPLATLVSQAHAVGIEVHAWIVPYRVSRSWPPTGNTTVAAHPEWLMVLRSDMGGGPDTIAGKYVLDPGSPDVQEYITSIIVELVSNYEIDGINFDYIRYEDNDAGYPAYTWYPNSTLARYRRWTGTTGTPPTDGDANWNDFRRRTIDELVRRTRAEIATITSNPRQPLRFSADLICFGGPPTQFEDSDAYGLFQNWRKWMELGWLDVGIPMNYKRDWVSQEASWYRQWVIAAIGWRYDRHLVCGQANYLNPKANSVNQLEYCMNAGADGTSNYSYYGTADENKDGSWETDWTWYSYVAANLFTQVAPTPDMPWRNPTTATEGTVWGRVADPLTDEPIDGALIEAGTRSCQTDGNGLYTLTLLPAAPGGTAYTVTASYADCATVQIPNVTVLPGDVVRRDVPLCNSAAGDMDEDGFIDGNDLPLFLLCLKGPGSTYAAGHVCLNGDDDFDDDIDLSDLSNFQQVFGTP